MFIIFKDFNIKTKSENNKPPTTGGGIQNLFNINIFLVRKFPKRYKTIERIKVPIILNSISIIGIPLFVIKYL